MDLKEMLEQIRNEPPSQVCTTCSRLKPMTDFAESINARNGKQNECRKCKNARTQVRNHGISVMDYDIMLARQGGRCAICGVEAAERRLHIDHDHSCRCGQKSCPGCRRSLLCVNCNTGLGMFRDDTTIMTKAIAYVEQWRNTHGRV